jgi:hypothetical protein
MATAGKYLIPFRADKNSAGELFELHLYVDATKDESGTFTTETLEAENLNIWLKDWGTVIERLDDREFSLSSSFMDVVLLDMSGWLVDLFEADLLVWDNLKILFYKYVSGTWEKEFVGFANNEFRFNIKNKELSIEFGSRNDRINSTPTFIDGSINNTPMGSGFSQSSLSDYFLVTDVIERLFKIANPDLTEVKIEHDWIFRDGNIGYSYSKTLEEIYFQTKYLCQVETLGGWVSNGMNSYGDVLRTLAFDLGCIAGFTDGETAIFQNIFSPYNTVNIQEHQVLDYERANEGYYSLSYIRVFNSQSVFATVGTVSSIPEDGLEKYGYSDVYRFFGADDLWHNMNAIYNPEIGFYVKEDFQALFWAKYFLRDLIMRRDSLTVSGHTIKIFNTVVYRGINYRPVEIERNYLKNQSKLKLMIL